MCRVIVHARVRETLCVDHGLKALEDARVGFLLLSCAPWLGAPHCVEMSGAEKRRRAIAKAQLSELHLLRFERLLVGSHAV